MQEVASSSGLSPRRRRVLVALVCLQVAVPLWATAQNVPHMFGFHMFTGYQPFSVVVLDGEEERIEVDLSDWITVPREDVDWSRRLGSAICADTPEAATVIVRQWRTNRTHTC